VQVWRWRVNILTSSHLHLPASAGVGCAGGGSNFAGFAYPFLHQNLTAGKTSKIIAVEPASAPVVKMYTLGHTFIPPGIHAGGLRYHGTPALARFARKRGASVAPSVSALVNHGDIEARAVKQLETFAAAVQFSKAEGTPALAFRCKCHPRPRERARHSGGD
jgi:tryptophan synthase beta chain